MGRAFAEIAFTPTVRMVQTRMGSRGLYEDMDRTADRHDRLTEREAAFLGRADHFYQATVGENGWPYVQHRGGPPGFLRVLSDRILGYADFSGNLQYVSVGNLETDDRIALIVMDYARRRRLKILARVRMVGAEEDPDLVETLRVPGYEAKIDRSVLLTVEAWDWNCPQHITPRFTQAEIDARTAPLQARIAELEAQLAATGRDSQA